MKAITPNEIRFAVHGRWLSQGADVTVDGVTTDSRTAKPGDLFVAIKGPKHDGHDHLLDAAKAGCISAIVQRDLALAQEVVDIYGGGLIGVEDTVAALGELAGFHRQQVPASVVAVTGSNGKTTVKRMIHHILGRRLTGSASPKSFNNAIGVPLTLLDVAPGDDYVVCEAGTNAPGEILGLARIIQPNLAVITSAGPAHLEGLDSVDRVAIEKASLLAALAGQGLAIVRGDQVELERALVSYDCRIIRFGESDTCDLRLTGYEPRVDGQRFQINDRLWVELPLLGRHNALNALSAIAAAQRFGFEQQAAAEALGDFTPSEMRLEMIDAGQVRIVNDAYNANPASVLAAADVLSDLPGERRVMILGDMLELGKHAEELHAQVGRQIAGRRVDLLIAAGPMGRYIAQGAAEAGMDAKHFGSVKVAQRSVMKLLRPGDMVLLKGSRATAMERLVDPIRKAFA